MKAYLKEFWDKVKESAVSVLPFFAIIIVLYLIFLDFNFWAMLSIILATLIMIGGMALFNVGVDMSTMKMGGYVGSNLSKSRRFWFMIILSFILGFIVTIAEPDLMVLAEQVPGISSKWVILITVSAGTGIFLILSTLRTLFRWSIKWVLIFSYLVALILCAFSPLDFLPLAFDTVGVTTGTVSVPFIMAFGLGICAVRSGSQSQEDGFGLIALASIGPAIAVLIMSLFINSDSITSPEVINTVTTASEMGGKFLTEILAYLKEVFIVIIPIFLFFLIYNFIFLKLPKTTLLRIFIGLLYTYIGLVIFISGVTSGYLPTANILGSTIAGSSVNWILLPLSIIIGFCLIFAEPAVHVLNKQVEDITDGVIGKKTMLVSLSIGVAVATLIVVVRALYSINFFYFIVPLIVIMVALSIYAPNLFVAIAFDSGGVAAGTLTASFVLPFVVGICNELGASTMQYAFGSVAMVAIIPTIVILIMGVRYNYVINKNKKAEKPRRVRTVTIIDFD